MSSNPSFVISAQFQTILAFLQRHVVQRQLLALGGAVLVGWAASSGLAWILSRLSRTSEEREQARPLTIGIEIGERIAFPLLGILTARLLSFQFQRQGWPDGLIREAGWLLWAFLAYRVLTAALAATLGDERMRRYQARVIAPFFWFLIGWKILDFAINLDAVAQVQVLQLANNPVHLGTLVTIAVVLYFLFSGSWAVQNALRSEVIPRARIEPGRAYGLLTVGRYLIIVAASFFVLRALGFDTSTLAFISGGLSVAIAFGSQQVFANFVSGVLLLFEQSLRPGDVISIGNEMGVVENLSIRSTTIRTLDNVSLVVPNQSLLTSAVKNYTKTDPKVRVPVRVTVKYRDGLEELREAMLLVARNYRGLCEQPEPEVLFPLMTQAKVTAELSVWITDALRISEVTSELNHKIWDAATEKGFELA